MRRLLIAVFLLLTGAAFAQRTTVTALVVDQNGTVYQNCSFNVSWTNDNPTSHTQPNFGGSTSFQQNYPGLKCDSSGNLSIQLPPNTLIQPQPNTWLFSVCDQTGAYCGSVPVTVGTSSPLSISTLLTNGLPLLPPPGTSGIQFLTNGALNPLQGKLNLIAGTNITLSTDIFGGVTINSSGGGGGGSGPTLATNGVNNGSQSLLNLQQGSGIQIDDDGSGTLTFTNTGTAAPPALPLTPTTSTTVQANASNVAVHFQCPVGALASFICFDFLSPGGVNILSMTADGTIQLNLGNNGTAAGLVNNASGNKYHVDGVKYTSLDSTITALCGSSKQVADVDVDIVDTLNQDEFQQCSGQYMTLRLTRVATPYILNAAQHIAPHSSFRGVAGANTVSARGTWVQRGPSFPASLPTPAAGPTAVLTTTCPNGVLTKAGAGVYKVQYTLANVNGPTAASPITTLPAVDGTTQCIAVTSPGAIGNALSWELAVTLEDGDDNSASFYQSAAIGTDITVPGTQGQPSLSLGDPLPNYNHSGDMILEGGKKLSTGAWVLSESGPEIDEMVSDMLIDGNGIHGGLAAGWDGVTCWANGKGQENSGAENVFTENCGSDGVFQNAAMVVEGLNGGRGANNSHIWNIQGLGAHLSTCGAAGTSPCNPILANTLSEQVKSFRGVLGASTFYTDGVSTHCYLYVGVTGVNASAANTEGLGMDLHCEGKNSDMTYGIESIGMPLTLIHINVSSTSGGTAGIHLDSGSCGSTFIGVQPGTNRAFIDDCAGFTSPAGADQDIPFYSNGTDKNHVITSMPFKSMLSWSGGWTSNSNVAQYDCVKVATGVDNKVVKCATGEVDKTIGIALNATTTGSDPLDVAWGGMFPPGAGPLLQTGTCASGQWVRYSTVTAGQVVCVTTKPTDVWTLGKAVAANSTPGTSVQMTINPQPPYIPISACAAVGTAASPSVVSCGSATTGLIACDVAASGATCQVNTSAVASTSVIVVTASQAENTPLSVTCNNALTFGTAPLLRSKSAGSGFILSLPTFVTNPACFNYVILNPQ